MTTINQRRLATARRELLRSLGRDLRQTREDAGRSQAAIARVASVSAGHLSRIEAGDAQPSLEVLMAIAAALGNDLSLKLFSGTGPRLRDQHQIAMSEALLGILHPRWRRRPRCRSIAPFRGVVDLVLDDPDLHEVVASELAQPVAPCRAAGSMVRAEGRRDRGPAG